jgi:hypothetical protein
MEFQYKLYNWNLMLFQPIKQLYVSSLNFKLMKTYDDLFKFLNNQSSLLILSSFT